jgi:Rod binding domain-containing protein
LATRIATDYAEQQFATVLAQRGGLGLADMIAKGLERRH